MIKNIEFKFDIFNVKYKQIISKEMDPTIDYTLKINFTGCNITDLYEILKILYNSSEECQKDILELADEVINRINIIGYDLKKSEYKKFSEFVHYLFKVLKKIKAEKHVRIIYETYNHYIKDEPNSPVMNSPKSPEVTEHVKPPKIMRKVKNVIRRN
tara:strand:+ start:2853 stop:3323 length:471 start_codon:yes stop_codon:yes gene_type:complete